VKDVTTIGLDLAKHVFQAYGADAEGAPLFNRKLRRAAVCASSRNCRRAWSGWKHAPVRTIGRAKLLRLATKSGCYRLST